MKYDIAQTEIGKRIDDVEIEQEIWSNLRNSLDALSIVFGEDFISS